MLVYRLYLKLISETVNYLGFTTRQDYFTHSETSQSLGGAKTEIPEENPDHPRAEIGLPHITRARLEPIAVR